VFCPYFPYSTIVYLISMLIRGIFFIFYKAYPFFLYSQLKYNIINVKFGTELAEYIIIIIIIIYLVGSTVQLWTFASSYFSAPLSI
jgi:hypothetical protein